MAKGTTLFAALTAISMAKPKGKIDPLREIYNILLGGAATFFAAIVEMFTAPLATIFEWLHGLVQKGLIEGPWLEKPLLALVWPITFLVKWTATFFDGACDFAAAWGLNRAFGPIAGALSLLEWYAPKRRASEKDSWWVKFRACIWDAMPFEIIVFFGGSVAWLIAILKGEASDLVWGEDNK